MRAPRSTQLRGRALLGVVAVGAAAATSFAGVSASAVAATPADRVAAASAALQRDVGLPGVLRHLRALQEVADRSDGNRAAGTTGYDRSAGYVFQRLRAAGYDVHYQEFTFDRFTVNKPTIFEQVAPDAMRYEEGTAFRTATFTGSGDATGTLLEVDVVEPPGEQPDSSTSGCEPEDFAGFPDGGIALLQRGSCPFGQKAQNAAEAGAAAAVLYNEGTPGRPERTELFFPTLKGYDVTIPVVAVGYQLGRALVGTQVRVATDVTVDADAPTRNVIAETRHGYAENVVMLGAHLDSVDDGPGINDNGSGAAAILEVAEQLARAQAGRAKSTDPRPTNKVRFAFWGAEESGLLGSTEYVTSLSEAERSAIALYLNFDMVGSPNYIRGVYDGDASLPGSTKGPEGSAAIEHLFNAYFAGRSLPYEDTPFDGRSDYKAFIAAGIPAGGLFTGAEDEKTEEQVARYGGVVAAFDPCYHRACDSFTPRQDGADDETYAALREAYGEQLRGNINLHALDTSADAIAHAVATYAYDTSSVTGPVPAR